MTISIVSGGDPALLEGCLRTVAPAAGDATVEVVVTDNASGGALADVQDRAAENVRFVRNTRMAGFGRNHNLALGDAAGRYLFVLNDDTELDPGCIGSMVRFMDQNPGVGCVGPRVRYPDGHVQPSAFHFPSPGRVALTAATLQRRGWIESGGDQIRPVDWVSGCAMLFRAEAWRAVGGFDEQFYMYCEDTDVCLRLSEQRWAVAFFPPAGLTHFEYGSSGTGSERRIYQHARSRGIYSRKHYGTLGSHAVQGMTAAMFAARLAASRVLGRPADERERFAAHIQASLHPEARPAIEDAAAEKNGTPA